TNLITMVEFWTRTRFIVLVLLLLCMTFVCSNILSFNFAVICMAPDPNATAPQEDRYTFTEIEDTFITATVAIASLVANIPLIFMINRIGIRCIFTVLGLLSGIATVLIPTAVRSGFAFLLVCRAVQGVAFASLFPAVGTFAAKWTYYKQTGLFVSVLVAYVQFAPVITSPVSGALCNSSGWPSVFYFHGGITLALFSSYAFFYRNTPKKHPFVGDA
ncbi:hypothetical protein PRIPAC_70750, partial [Pristionchus pacificus]